MLRFTAQKTMDVLQRFSPRNGTSLYQNGEPMCQLLNSVCRIIYAAFPAAQTTTTTKSKRRLIVLNLAAIVFSDQFIVKHTRVIQFLILTCNARQNVIEKPVLEHFLSQDSLEIIIPKLLSKNDFPSQVQKHLALIQDPGTFDIGFPRYLFPFDAV